VGADALAQAAARLEGAIAQHNGVAEQVAALAPALMLVQRAIAQDAPLA
jgi:HPt (histidine-containing phosphotransfer) domain-containing protein